MSARSALLLSLTCALTCGRYLDAEDLVPRLRQAWLVTLDRPHKLRYEELDPNASYTLRLAGFGEAKPRADGVPLIPTRYRKAEGAIKEFPIANVQVHDGVLEITFDALCI